MSVRLSSPSADPATRPYTLGDVTRAQGAYGEPLAASVWCYGYTVSRCLHGGHLADAVRYMASVRRILARCTADARAYCVREYMAGRRAGIDSYPRRGIIVV